MDATFREIPCEIRNRPSANLASAGIVRRPADLRLPRPKMRPRKGAFPRPNGFRQHRVGEPEEGAKKKLFFPCGALDLSIKLYLIEIREEGR